MATEAEERLRLLLGEQIPDGGSEGDTFFTDAQITLMLANNSADLNLSALEGWTMKMARYARNIDISEAGAERKLSQKYRQAREMAKYFASVVSGIQASNAASYRVIARVANLDESCDLQVDGTPFSGSSENIRIYPLHRFLLPEIMG